MYHEKCRTRRIKATTKSGDVRIQWGFLLSQRSKRALSLTLFVVLAPAVLLEPTIDLVLVVLPLVVVVATVSSGNMNKMLLLVSTHAVRQVHKTTRTVVSRLVFQAKLLFGSRVGQTNRTVPTVGQMTNCNTFHLVEHAKLVNQASISAPANRQRATTIGKTIASTCLSADYNPRRKTVWQRPATHRVKHDHDNPEWRFRPSYFPQNHPVGEPIVGKMF